MARPAKPQARRRAPKAIPGELSVLSASIVATLKERIVGWNYPPEHRLTELGLCREFGVSRSPVREALRALVANGLVRKLANRGYAVRQLDLYEVQELYDLRTALELHAAEQLAASDSKRAQLEALKGEWKAILDGAPRKGEELAQLDAKFHETLAELAGNRMLLADLRRINERLLVLRMIDFGRDKRADTTCRQHMKVIERILARDPPGAREAMRRNIDDGRDNVNTSIKEALANAFSVAPRAPLPKPRARRQARRDGG
jgi:DNA-binding GntR family transcriptional regulator